MKLLAAIAIVLLSAAGCAQRTRTARSPAPPAAAPISAFDRQIRNAQDAGDGDYPLRLLRERVAAEPDSVPARLELAKAYQQRGYPDVALEMCRLTAARFPASGEVELALVSALRDLNQRPEAIASLNDFLAAHPQTTPAYSSWIGILNDETGQWTSGEPAHRKALDLAPAQDYLHNNLGYNLLMQKKPDAAAAEFREALRLNPSSEVARNNLGLALADQNSNQQAVASWQLSSDPASAHNNLAAVLIQKGNYPEARKELQIALGYNRAHPAALKNLELVSRLDGSAATMPSASMKTGWERWKAGFLRLFVGPLDESKPETSREGQ
ncbi:MAG TPA: tetratricopeptide repeat protein [Candidatus Sulfopaludibacter sp.]|jgi:Flp pilus assembly protein TadD|nr:tetratricopeptide repeat protein [Candidatus Sulfopaludibacter sp.]